MHVAAKWGKIKMVNLLMSKGANIEAKTRDGLTPLHCAARSGHHEVVDILIEKGAPIGSKTKVRVVDWSSWNLKKKNKIMFIPSKAFARKLCIIFRILLQNLNELNSRGN